MKIENFEQQMYEFIDNIREALSPGIWENILLDCTKNELLVMWLLYRRKEVNMSQVAEDIHVPLNTATGIIARMEKRELVIRERSPEDKRIVIIRFSAKGEAQLHSIVREITYYGTRILSEFSQEEMELLFRVMSRLTAILKEERGKECKKTGVRKIEIE